LVYCVKKNLATLRGYGPFFEKPVLQVSSFVNVQFPGLGGLFCQFFAAAVVAGDRFVKTVEMAQWSLNRRQNKRPWLRLFAGPSIIIVTTVS
jgi:hypothetical protein